MIFNCFDTMKKYLFRGHESDIEYMTKELGSVANCIAVSAYAIGHDFETVCQILKPILSL